MKTLILFALFTVFVIGCGENTFPQAKLETKGIACQINKNLRDTMDEYFRTHPIPKNAQQPTYIKKRKGSHIERCIVLRKNRILTNSMTFDVLIYTESGVMRTLSPDFLTNSGSLDLIFQPRAEVLFWDNGDNRLWEGEATILNEEAVCIPE